MSSSSKTAPPPRAPLPPGGRQANVYQRFIPREELGDFASWSPGELDDAGPATAAPARRAAASPETRAGASVTPPAPAAPPSPFAPGMPGAAGTRAAPAPPPPEPDAAEWARRLQAARQDGYRDGYRDGLVALEGFKQSFAQQTTRQVGALLEAFDAQTQALDAALARVVAETAVALAQQVLRTELRTHPALVARVAAEAVDAVLPSARRITVHAHPLDLALVAAGAEEALSARGARLLPDSGVERGGVRVDSDVGAVDARIAERWRLAAEGLGSARRWDDAPAPTDRGGAAGAEGDRRCNGDDRVSRDDPDNVDGREGRDDPDNVDGREGRDDPHNDRRGEGGNGPDNGPGREGRNGRDDGHRLDGRSDRDATAAPA